MTNQDQTAQSPRPERPRLEPKPVSRPPVDPAQTRAFGRPDGVSGSFLGADKHRDQGEYTPRDQAPDPVLADAFGRPDGVSDT
ncbi:MAG: serine protease, partial [Actinomycetota bacterium]|nr:serine protease [Actinomycetota bacterium]